VHAKGERALAKSIIGSKTREKNVEQQNAKPLRVVRVVPGMLQPIKKKKRIRFDAGGKHAQQCRARKI